MPEPTESAPHDPRALIALAGQHRHAGRLRDAVIACDAALRIAPAYADAWLERGFVYASGGSMARAGECYAQVLALEPDNPSAHAGLAGIAARDGDGAAARYHANAALAVDPHGTAATLALATVEHNDGNPAATCALLEPMVARLSHPEPDRSLAFTLLGDAYSRLGDYPRAHGAYVRAKADFAAIHAQQFTARPPHRVFVAAVTDALIAYDFVGDGVGDAGLPQPGAPARHLFLLGYPRSGNTLVENVLASLPDVVALEERPTLRAADRVWLAAPDGLNRLAVAKAAELAEIRGAYWRKVAEVGGEIGGRTLVDMDPLKGTRLPMIARLFPAARILITRRDPRDVVWSCFKTNFALTNPAMDFTTIESTARHYDAMMRLIETARERLALAFYEVRYEALVAAFDPTTQDLCRFVGLPWSAETQRFDRTAQSRGVTTASAGQVRRGLYDGSGQWRPYAAWLEPVLPILAPWIERFGYEA